MQKVLKGMSAYLNKVKKVQLGKSELDYLMINTPPICNFRCKKCFTSANLRELKNPLKLNEINNLVKFAKKKGAKVVCILGEGEPLVYSKFKRIISLVDKYNLISLIATNGRLLTKSMINFLYDHNTTVVVSLDTLDTKEYSKFCGGNADLKILLENLEYARKKFSKAIRVINGIRVYRLGIHMTVTAKNFKNLGRIKEFCGEDIYFDCQPLADVGSAEKNPTYIGDKNTYNYYQKMSKELYPPMVISKTSEGEYCALFYYGFSVGYEGEVMFDTHAIESKHFGNIRKFSTEDLFYKVREIKEIFKKKYATSYCPVRDRNYKKFLKFLKKQPYEPIQEEKN